MDRALRVAALGLILYGLLGFGLLLLGYTVASQTFAEIRALQGALLEQRTALVGSLRATSRSLDIAGGSLVSFEQTLAEARGSSEQAALFARELSGTMSDLAAAAQISILGLQPFGRIGQGFGRAGTQLTLLADQLEVTSGALGQNVGDLELTRASIDETRRQVDGLASAFEITPLPGAPGAALDLLELAIYGLLIWLAAQAALSILLGAALFRRAHTRLFAYYGGQAALPPHRTGPPARTSGTVEGRPPAERE